MVRLGYACINLSSEFSTNRSMKKATFLAKGITYVSELALKNAQGLLDIVKWNNNNGLQVYRMSSSLFPWMSEYELCELPDYIEISKILSEVGKTAKLKNQRLGFHPGHFNQLGSINPNVVIKTVKELNQHSEIMDLVGLPHSYMSKINIHIGNATGGKILATERFCENFSKLNASTKARLVIENDDKAGLYTVQELYDLVHLKIRTPITFDYLHHYCNPGLLSEEDALKLATSTWNGDKPCTHYSSSKKLHEDSSSKLLAHADYIYDEINYYGVEMDIVCECKAKELAVIKYTKDYITKDVSETPELVLS